MYRLLAPHDDLDNAMCIKSERKVSKALTLQYDHVMFILDP